MGAFVWNDLLFAAIVILLIAVSAGTLWGLWRGDEYKAGGKDED